MVDITERRLGFGFGLLGGGLFVLAALIGLMTSVLDAATGHATSALNAGSSAIALFVIGGLALLFAYLAHRNWSNRPIVSGVLLVVIAALGWGVLGFGANVIALIGAIFVFLAGVLFLVEPVKTEVAHLTTA